ncbi:subtilisin-chymotrypsin inhibitor CI-1B-like [Phragmites australis]|uniref:subtilisin-chymotrypsin inhibitor CI-1B-like n=1 Tax=Phragmites australis TaxID=29695 RepID=UPI002D785E10|nr:subtilisin-chymotrypsin inhibitor CI-1B-like [Phragmites australis]
MGRAAPAADGGDDLKSSWPEVVGWVTLNAAFKISSDRPDVSTDFYMIPTPLPNDYNPRRVIIVCDDRSVVVKTPVVG